MAYFVVFEGTGEEGSNYKGIRVYVDYQTPECFQEMVERGENKDIILAQGVTEEEARRLCDEVRTSVFIAAAWEEAIASGVFDPAIFELKVRTAQMREKYLRTGSAF